MSRLPKGWPVLLLALPAFVAIWSGWVDLGRLTGFGVVHPLPGIADGFALNTAITLPIGLETYAAYALHVWLTRRVSDRARRFAKWSAVGSLVLGALGQVAYHLMVAAGITSAPWWITTIVACIPVAVLGMGAALAHLVHADEPEPVQKPGPLSPEEWAELGPDPELDPSEYEPVDPWTKSEPIREPVQPEPVHEPEPEPVQDEPADEPEPVQPETRSPIREVLIRRVMAQSMDTESRVKTAHAMEPHATNDRIAELAQCSVSSVKRHRPKGSPSEPPPAQTQVNGHKPSDHLLGAVQL